MASEAIKKHHGPSLGGMRAESKSEEFEKNIA